MVKREKRNFYSAETKLEAIRLFEVEGLSQKEIAERLGVPSAKQIRTWLWVYRKEGEKGFRKKRRGRPPIDRNSLEERIKQLEMENTLLKALAIELGEELPEELDIEPFIDTEGNSE
jgi:transposase